MRYLFGVWRNISIAKKLYFVIGIMAFLIGAELLTLRFAMRQLSAARGFVGGESLWSKAQKDAVFSLQRFGLTGSEKDYEAFLEHLKVNEGDHEARIELMKENPDLNRVRKGFLAGHIHPEDIDPIVYLLRNFYWISYLSRAIDIWTKADELLFQLKGAGKAYHVAVLTKEHERANAVLNEVKRLNKELTVVEEEFSFVLGEGSRWLEKMVLSLLLIAVVMVESVGLGLAFITTRAISRGLSDLGKAAERIGEGDFSQKVNVQSRDEIGKLGESVNAMGEMLHKSYSELEKRVAERTTELNEAVRNRDEFLSVASHELRTPLTSLSLQLQILAEDMRNYPQVEDPNKFVARFDSTLKLTKKIAKLLDGLLDLTRLEIGKFKLLKRKCDLAALVSDVVTQMGTEAAVAGSSISVHAAGPVVGDYDALRMGQVIGNLLSNAIKYGGGRPIEIHVLSEEGTGVIRVRDNGIGIASDEHERIFDRFERGRIDPNVAGLGLGLYISKQIVKAHGGTITVESAPGTGSTFTVRLQNVEAKASNSALAS